MAKGGDLIRQRLRAERDRLPREIFARQRKNVALLVAREEENERLVGIQELLRFIGRQRLGTGERRVVRKLLLEPPRVRGQLSFDLGDLPADVVDRGLASLTFR